MQKARSVYWKKWAGKHEYEELKEEHGWNQGWLSCERKCTASQSSQGDVLGRWMDAKETVRCWLVGYQSMSSLPDGGRHREAQALPLPRVIRSQTGDSRGLQKVGAKSKNLKEGVEVAKRYCCASSQ